MQIRFWGTRGSIAKPGARTLRYGGNTACVEVRTEAGARLVIDCGTGAHELGRAIMAEGGASRGHMLISHTHWDHIQGIPFFAPFFAAGHEWDLYAPQGFGESLRDTLGGQMEYTYFPITPEAFGANVRYNNLGEGRFVAGAFVVHTRYLNHTALTLAFRIEAEGAAIVYACDHEPHDGAAAAGGAALAGEDLAHARFMAGADLIIHDAQYLAEEYAGKRGWGHSTVEYAVEVARTAGAGRVVLTHHDPLRSDDEIDAIVARLRGRAAADGPEIIAAAEGLVLAIDPRRQPTAAAAGDARDAIREGAAGAVPRLLIVAADDALADRVARAIADEAIAIVRARSIDEAVPLARDVAPALILVDAALAVGALAGTLGGDDAAPLVLLGGAGPTDPAFARLEAPWTDEYARTRIRTWLMRAECQWLRPPVPDDEAARLAALGALRILDTAPEERFDRLTRLAAGMFRVPVSLISLVDADRQWFKSCLGADIGETPRDTSFCAHAVASRSMLVVTDTLADPRFRDNPMVASGPRVRFYAGAPIHSAGGHPIGTLCILDVRPRELSAAERGLLTDLAATVETELVRGI